MKIASVGALFFASLSLFAAHGFAEEPADARQTLALSGSERDWVLGDMRGHLAAITAVVSALSQGDFETARKAATENGMIGLAYVPKTIPAKTSDIWKEWMRNLHMGFDAVADGLAKHETEQQVLRRVGGLMQNCVACHATYRIVNTP